MASRRRARANAKRRRLATIMQSQQPPPSPPPSRGSLMCARASTTAIARSPTSPSLAASHNRSPPSRLPPSRRSFLIVAVDDARLVGRLAVGGKKAIVLDTLICVPCYADRLCRRHVPTSSSVCSRPLSRLTVICSDDLHRQASSRRPSARRRRPTITSERRQAAESRSLSAAAAVAAAAQSAIQRPRRCLRRGAARSLLVVAIKKREIIKTLRARANNDATRGAPLVVFALIHTAAVSTVVARADATIRVTTRHTIKRSPDRRSMADQQSTACAIDGCRAS